MRIKVLYVVNNTTKTARFLCDSASAQIAYEGSIINFVDGRDKSGPIDVLQGSNIELIEHRPGAADDEEWLRSVS